MVRAGYKKTEVGEIPESWEETCLGDQVIKVGSGITPTGGSTVYKENGRPFVRSQNVGWGNLRLADLAYIDEETHQTFPASEIKTGDVLLNITGASIGRCSIANDFLDGGNVNQHVCIIRTKKELDQKYVSYLLLSSIGQSQIDSFQAGGNREGLNFGQIRSFQLPKPKDVSEQKAIAKALSDVDELIVSLEKLIAKKRDIKTGTMQQLLTGKKRLAGFGEGNGYKQTELGEIPEDWEVKTYDDAFSFYTTASNSRDDLSENGLISYIHYGDIHTKWNITLDMSISNLPGIDRNQFKGAAFIKDGDVIMADASEDYEGIGKSIEVCGIGEKKCIAGLHTFLLRDRDCTYVDGFRGYLHMMTAVKTSFDRLATGLKVYGLSKNTLKTVHIPVPPKKEQERIVEILSGMTEEIGTLSDRLKKTKAIKQGMMQELLTGRTRLI